MNLGSLNGKRSRIVYLGSLVGKLSWKLQWKKSLSWKIPSWKERIHLDSYNIIEKINDSWKKQNEVGNIASDFATFFTL